MLYLLHTYHLSSVYFSEVQESIICVVHRYQILSDVKYSNHIVTSTGMAIRIQLQYCYFFLYNIIKTITHRCRLYCLFFNIYFIFTCNCHLLYMLFLHNRYGSLHTRTASLGDFCVKSFCMFIHIANLYL